MVTVYQFQITLIGTNPRIWRRIQCQDCTLDKFHQHIQTAMGWENSHLHQFEVDGERYCNPKYFDDGLEEYECIDSTRTKISDLVDFHEPRFTFLYVYDMGDFWKHEIVFEGVKPAERGKKYPVCLEGERACPPEDVGGIWGYEDFLAAISDPNHEDHEYQLEWCNGSFSPEEFDSKKATQQMRDGLPFWGDM
ncbi:MAG: hypothetical protein Tsb009_35360 [Planctomycetaceae bacterium]